VGVLSYKFALVDKTTREVVAADPLVSSMPGDIAGVYYAIATNDSPVKYRMVPEIVGFLVSSETSVEDLTHGPGVLFSRTFTLYIPVDMKVAGSVFVRVKTGAYNTVTNNTGDAYRVNVRVYKNGSTVIGTTNGETHIPNSTSEVTYTDILCVDLTATDFSAGDSLDIKVEIEVTSVDSTNPGINVKLYMDPSTSGDELIFYLQVT